MTSQPEIKIGLLTEGEPRITVSGNNYLLDNLLIGLGFHWQKTIPVKLSGKIDMLSLPQHNIHCINILGIEDYLKSVIGSEMSPDCPMEFLKAHAVISRSWALRKISNKSDFFPSNPTDTICWEESDSHIGFDVCSDDHCQRYQGIQEQQPRLTEAVTATYSEVLVDSNGMTADTRFSKCCGGFTETFSTCWADMDYHYLISKEDPWCDLSSMDPVEREKLLGCILKKYDRQTTDFIDWETETDTEYITQKIKERFNRDIGRIKNIYKIETGKSGRIKRLGIEGTKQTIVIGKELTIRRLLDKNCLYSSWFDIRKTTSGFRLAGHGWGHGVGLCQIGAARMAYEGYNYRDILEFYYPGTRIIKAYE